LVLPLFGPSNVRDAGGLMVDSALRYALTTSLFNSVGGMSDGQKNVISNSITVLDVIDARHQQKFRYNGSDYPFEYEMVHWLGGEKRKLEALK
jgi:phospholipid-binding lipoprotein MlaA